MPAAATRDNVTHVLGICPFPNVVSFMRDAFVQAGVTVPTGGHVVPHDMAPGKYDPGLSISEPFLTAGEPLNLLSASSLQSMPNKPRLLTVRGAGDKIVPQKHISSFLNAYADAAGSEQVEDFLVPNCGHGVNDEMLEAIKAQSRIALSDLQLPYLALVRD